jgi:crotonobetainyl-CoA:carnitine CoA-transferase CaiB-like acyl-CoA transferase
MSSNGDNALGHLSAAGSLLSGLQVVEYAGRISARIAGWIFAGLGAQVTRIVPADGAGLEAHMAADEQAVAQALDRGKRIVIAGEGSPVPSAVGVVLTSGEGRTGRPVLPAELDPSVSVHITPYGLEGDYSDFLGSELNVSAYSAIAAYVGEQGKAPIVPPFMIAANQTAIVAVIGALASLRRQGRTELDLAEADILVTNHTCGSYSLSFFLGDIPGRAGRRRPNPYPYTVLPCQDGWVAVLFLAGKQWAKLVQLMGTPEWSKDPRFKDRRIMGIYHADELDVHVTAWLKQYTKAELRDIAVEHKIPLAPLQDLDDLLADRQFAARQFLSAPEPGHVSVPRVPFLFEPVTTAPAEPAPVAADGLPLQGLRVLDLSWVLSGPTVGGVLSDLGADVVKVESSRHLDASRVGLPLIPDATDAGDNGQLPNLMPHFNNINRGKRSIVLDVGSPLGQEVLARLVADADVVLENFGAGSLERLGLGPDWFQNQKRNIVLLRISMAGQTGPDLGLRGYAAQSTALGGLDALCGYDATEPDGMITLTLGDVSAGLYGTVAVLAALRARDERGVSGTIDLAMTESAAAHLGSLLAARQLDPAYAAPVANRHAAYSPHGLYPCVGDDAWVSIAIRSDSEWRTFSLFISDREDAAGWDLTERRKRSGEINEWISAWTQRHEPSAAVEALQAAGIAAGYFNDVQALLVDANNRSRGGVVDVDHHVLGYLPIYGSPFHGQPNMVVIRGRAPDLGEHTKEVLVEAYFTPEEIAAYAGADTFESFDINGEDASRNAVVGNASS